MTTSKDPEQNGDDANASKPPKPEQQHASATQQKQTQQTQQQQQAEKKPGNDAKDGSPSNTNGKSSSPPKKRRKVNHGAHADDQVNTDDRWLTGSDSMHLLQTFGEPPHSRPPTRLAYKTGARHADHCAYLAANST